VSTAADAIVVIVMGVSGSGKTSLGRLLADRTHGIFLDADACHSEANIAKMSAGIALEDEDRWPWLDRVAAELAENLPAGGMIVSACSALKRRYRDHLRSTLKCPICVVCLTASRVELQRRVSQRPGHYWPAALLDSQLAILELPGPDEDSIVLSSELAPDDLVERVMDQLALKHARR
jgi:gluconokinase